jgi:hypothetical protein
MTRLQTAILGAINDALSVRPYGGAQLVFTPLKYSDGDTITILVEPFGNGLRVSDRGEAVDRLETWGVHADQGRAAEAIVAARSSVRLNPFASEPEELSTICDDSDLGLGILTVAQTALRVEQLRWLAKDRPALKFDDRLANRLSSVSSARHWRMTRRAKLPLASGRTRQVTAAVEGQHGTAYVQAVSDVDKDRSVANCYYIFDRSTASRSQRVAALAGAPKEWPDGLRDDLAEVGTVTFFADPIALERELELITGPALTV